jgi:hypothetical protein
VRTFLRLTAAIVTLDFTTSLASLDVQCSDRSTQAELGASERGKWRLIQEAI